MNHTAAGETFERNLKILRERFPSVAVQLDRIQSYGTNHSVNSSGVVEVSESVEGPVITVDGQPLDHPSKPKSGADSWVVRAISSLDLRGSGSLVVVGFGGGYHLESIVQRYDGRLIACEPSLEAFKGALRNRDLTELLHKLDKLFVGERLEDFTSISDLESAELIVRPQVVSLYPDYCNEIRRKLYAKRGLNQLNPAIAVLGPLQGGTLPICAYTHRALLANSQRSRALDMGGFNQTFSLIPNFTKDKFRTIGLQNRYLEYLSQVVLDHHEEKPFDVLVCMAQAPISFKALEELRKRGVITVLWFVEDYLRFTYWREAAQYYDFVFTIQRGECIKAIQAAGAREVHYLPTAADPDLHRPLQLSPEELRRWGSPLSFVGAGYHNRQQMFAALANMPFKIWGTEWPGCRPFDKLVQEEGRRLSPDEYIKIFNATQVNLNLHSSTERDGVDPYGDFINPRVFELAACGAFQLCDERSLLAELLTPGEEIITFSNLADLKDKIAYYLAHPEARQIIAERGRARVLREHTYTHRMQQMLEIIFQSRYEQLEFKEKNRPWAKMLKRAEIDPELQARCQAAFKRGEEPILDGLVSEVTTGTGKLTPTEQKLMFLFHVRKQMVFMQREKGDA